MKALVALVPPSLLLAGSILMFLSRRSVGSLLQLLGACGLVLVVFTHVCEDRS
jgi:hypothetical protein